MPESVYMILVGSFEWILKRFGFMKRDNTVFEEMNTFRVELVNCRYFSCLKENIEFVENDQCVGEEQKPQLCNRITQNFVGISYLAHLFHVWMTSKIGTQGTPHLQIVFNYSSKGEPSIF